MATARGPRFAPSTAPARYTAKEARLSGIGPMEMLSGPATQISAAITAMMVMSLVFILFLTSISN